MDLRALALFVLASQCPTHAAASRVAGVSASSVSGAVRGLERELGLVLFRPDVAGLVPTDAGRWLSHEAEGLLQLADALTGAPGPLETLSVRSTLRLTFGRLSFGAAAAARDFWRHRPGWQADLRFVTSFDDGGAAALEADVIMGYPGDGPGGAGVTLFEDGWVAVRNRMGPGAPDLRDCELWLPPISPSQEARLHAWSNAQSLPVPRRFEEDAAIFARLWRHGAPAALLAPLSLISSNLARASQGTRPEARLVAEPLDPPLASPVTARILTRDPARAEAATAYVRRLCAMLAAPPAPRLYEPALNLTHLVSLGALRSVATMTAAAKELNLSQPALSAQLRRIEDVLGEPMFERVSRGLVSTGALRKRAPLLGLVLERAQDIPRRARQIAVLERSEVACGLTAALGLGSDLAACFARALEDWRALLPEASLRIVEAPAATLRAALRRGDLGFALIDEPGAMRPGRDLAPLGLLVHATRDGSAAPIMPGGEEGVAGAFPGRPGERAVRGAGPALSLALACAGAGAAILPARLAEGRGLTLSPIEPATEMRLAAETTTERPLGEAERLLLLCLRRAFGALRPQASDNASDVLDRRRTSTRQSSGA